MSIESFFEIKVKMNHITINCTLTEPRAPKDPQQQSGKHSTPKVTTPKETTPKESTPKERTLRDGTPKDDTSKDSTPRVTSTTEIYFKIMMKSFCDLNEKQTC